LTHGHPDVTMSGRFYKSVQYGLDEKARIDYAQVEKLAKKHKPKVIVVGTTAYPFELNFAKFRKIADMVGAWLVADISHITGLVIGGEHPSPVPHADIVMSTTHKTFRGPRGAMILVTKRGLKKDGDLGKKIDSAIIPGLQGGPHNATTAGIAVAAKEAGTVGFKKYAGKVRKNADALAGALMKEGIDLVGGGTQTHLILIDLSEVGFGLGRQVAFAMDVAGIYANANTVPAEVVSPFYPSGIRIGTPLVTTRGMGVGEMKKIAKWIARVVEIVKEHELPEDRKARAKFLREFKVWAGENEELVVIRGEVKEMTKGFGLFEG
jgi:glycine hydroxymethyltransferase